MAEQPFEHLGERPRLLRAIIYIVHQCVLECDTPTRLLDVSAHRAQKVLQRIFSIERDELVSQFIVRRVQRNREVHLELFPRHALDSRHFARGRNGNAPSAQSKASGINEGLNGLPGHVEFHERLAHTHKDDVGDRRGNPRHMQHLRDDLARRQVADVTGLSSRTKWTANRAADLG